MCQFNLSKDDVADVVAEQSANLAQLKTQMIGIRDGLFADESDKIELTVLEQGPEGILPGVVHAFLIGLQLGQKYPTAVYPGKVSVYEYGDGGEEYDEEEETELTFQSVRNS
jgi:hypothetical protein